MSESEGVWCEINKVSGIEVPFEMLVSYLKLFSGRSVATFYGKAAERANSRDSYKNKPSTQALVIEYVQDLEVVEFI